MRQRHVENITIPKYLELFEERKAFLLRWNSNGKIDPQTLGNFIGQSYFYEWANPMIPLIKRVAPSENGFAAILFHSDEMDDIYWKQKPPLPVITYSLPKHLKNSTDFILIPNPYDMWGISKEQVSAAAYARIPFNERINKIIWRGGLHGNSERKGEPQRIELLRLAKSAKSAKNHDWLDAYESGSGNHRHGLEIKDQLKYKYHIDIGGVSGTTRSALRWKLASGSLVFKVDSDNMDWWHDELKPGVHYIPVKKDLSDLHSQWRWAEDHPELAEKIAQAGKEKCLESLTHKKMFEFAVQAYRKVPALSVKQIDAVSTFMQTYLPKSKSVPKSTQIPTNIDFLKEIYNSESPLTINSNNRCLSDIIDEIDLTTNVGSCGQTKCYFPTTNPSEGWLISNHKEPLNLDLRFSLNPFSLATTWQASWMLAKALEEKYGIRHLMLEAPEILNNGAVLSESEKELLDASIQKNPESPEGFRTLASYHGPVIVQKVKPAPTPYIQLKPENFNFEPHEEKSFRYSHSQILRLIQKIDNADEKESFAKQFEKDIQTTLSILKDNPFFAEDFHIIVDKTGKVYHSDLDGRFEYAWWSPTKVGDLSSSIMVDHVKTYLENWLDYVKAKTKPVSH